MRGAAATLAITGVVLAGCGGGGGGGGGPSKAEYVAQADAICRSTKTQAAPLIQRLSAAVSSPSAAHLRRAATIVGELRTIGTAYLSQLRALEQPGDDTTAIARFLTPTGRVVGLLAEARTALERGAAIEALGVLQNAQPLDAEAGAAARAYGFSRCGSLISTTP